uniref:40S ribosomal protein S3 n=1 Tax=Gymnochlora stellata TaxID=67809 RepID=B5A4G6_GYMST|nr:40S ribosomal protein S3 [Gymnochlora stellata]
MYIMRKFFINSLKDERFLRFFVYKNNSKTHFIFYCKLCRRTAPSLKNYFVKLFMKKKMSKIRQTKSNKKKLIRKIRKKKNMCGFHKNIKSKCFLRSQIASKKHIIKILLSRLLSERFTALRLNLRLYKKDKFSSHIQGLRLKKLLKYDYKRFRKEISNSLKYIMRNGARGCLIQIKGAHKSKRTRTVRFTRGFVSYAGGANARWTDGYHFNLKKKRGVIGIKIKILKSSSSIKRKSFIPPGKIAFLGTASVITHI